MPFYFKGEIQPVKRNWRNRMAFLQFYYDMVSVGTQTECVWKDGQVTVTLLCDDIWRLSELFEAGYKLFKGVVSINTDLVTLDSGAAVGSGSSNISTMP